jgi:voltage-gated potassium channel Kch
MNGAAMFQIRSLFLGLRAAFGDPRVLSLMSFTLVMVLCASAFYSYVEGWGALDAIYFSVITISTVGYGDFSPQTVPGKIFTMGYVLIGLGIFVAAATSVANAILSQREKMREDEDQFPDLEESS